MKTVPLRHLADLNPSTPEFERIPADEQVTFLPLETVWSDYRADHNRLAKKSDVANGYTRFRVGDVVCPKVTPTFQGGRSMVARSVGAGTTELHILRPREGVDARWLCYAVRSKHFLDEGVTAFQGVAGLQRVPPEFVNSFRVADYVPEEQRRIADFLDDRVSRIDRIIAARREQLELVDTYRSSSVDETFSAHAQGAVKVRRLLRERPSYGCLPGLVSERDDWPRYIRTTDIDAAGELRHSGAVTVEPDLLVDYALKSGDVLVARSGNTIGKCMVYQGRGLAVYAGYLVRLRFRELDPTSYWYFAKGTIFNEQLWANAIQSTIPNFNADRYAAMSMPDIRGNETVVLASLQKTFEDLRRLERLVLSSIGLLTEYRSSLITAAVTGEFDVSTAGSSIPG